MFRTRSNNLRRSVTPPRRSLDPRVGPGTFGRSVKSATSPPIPSIEPLGQQIPPARLASYHADAWVKELALDLPANALDLTALASEERYCEGLQGRSFVDVVLANRTKGATRENLVHAAADSDNALACNDSLRREAACAIIALEEATQNYSVALETRNEEEARRIRANEVVCGLEKVVERNATSLAAAQKAVKSACECESQAKYALDQAGRQLACEEAEEQASLRTLEVAQREHEMSIQEMMSAYQEMKKAQDDHLLAEQEEFEDLQQEGQRCLARNCAWEAMSQCNEHMRSTATKALEADANAMAKAAAGDPSGIPHGAKATKNATQNSEKDADATRTYDEAKKKFAEATHAASQATIIRREKEQELNDKTGRYHTIAEKERRDHGVVATCEKRHNQVVFKLQEARQEYAKAHRCYQRCKAKRKESEREEENLVQVHRELLAELQNAREIFHKCMEFCEYVNAICIECGTELARERHHSQNVREFAAMGWEDEATCRYGERLRRLEDMWATMQCSLQEDALANRTDNLAEAAARRGAAQDGYIHRERALDAEILRANHLKAAENQDEYLYRAQASDAEMMRANQLNMVGAQDERHRVHDLDAKMYRATRLNMGRVGARLL